MFKNNYIVIYKKNDLKNLFTLTSIILILNSCNKEFDCKSNQRFNFNSDNLIEANEITPNNSAAIEDNILLINDSATLWNNVAKLYDSKLTSIPLNITSTDFQNFSFITVNVRSGIPTCYYKPYFFELIDNGANYILKITLCKRKKPCFPKHTISLIALIKTNKLINKPISYNLVLKSKFK